MDQHPGVSARMAGVAAAPSPAGVAPTFAFARTRVSALSTTEVRSTVLRGSIRRVMVLPRSVAS